MPSILETTTVLDTVSYPHSAGVFYTTFTQYLGFPHYGDEYKIMGLAPYGEPKYVDQLRDVLIFKNNGLFYIPMKGPHSGQVFQVASAPVDAELTAPTFSPDGKTLFLCVQHPGDSTNKMGEFTSNWPGGKKEDMPRSAVVTIQGPLLDLLTT